MPGGPHGSVAGGKEGKLSSFLVFKKKKNSLICFNALQKILDFTSIDNFHGTGAFNQTRFPEWDSVFLECVDRPEEVIVLEMRQRRRQQKLSGHNAYFESLSSNNKKPKETVDDKKDEEPAKPTSFSTSNYFDAMKSTTNLTASAAAAAPPTVSKTPKVTSKKLSGASNYLDNLSSPVKAKPKWSPKKDETKEVVAKNDDEKKEKDAVAKKDTKKKPETKAAPRRAFASSSYLDNLSSVTNATTTSSDAGSSKQSTEESKNPYLEEVRLLELFCGIDREKDYLSC